MFAKKMDGSPSGSVKEGLLDIPITAHTLGGVSFGVNHQDGVVDLNCQVNNNPGLYGVDESSAPANPGVNPRLTFTALAEYAMQRVPPKPNAVVRSPVGVG